MRRNRPTRTGEIAEARRMRSEGMPSTHIAGYLDRDPKWVRKYTDGFEPPPADPRARAKLAVALRDKGLKWDHVAWKAGYRTSASAQVSVCVERRRQREEMNR